MAFLEEYAWHDHEQREIGPDEWKAPLQVPDPQTGGAMTDKAEAKQWPTPSRPSPSPSTPT